MCKFTIDENDLYELILNRLSERNKKIAIVVLLVFHLIFTAIVLPLIGVLLLRYFVNTARETLIRLFNTTLILFNTTLNNVTTVV